MKIRLNILLVFFVFSNLSLKGNFKYPKIRSHREIPTDPAKRSSSYPYISGDTFRAVCDFIIDETNIPFDPKYVNDGDTIFVKHQKEFLDFFFKNIHPLIKSKYILISHNGLCDSLNVYKKYLDDMNIVAWLGKNVVVDHPKASSIPLGVSNNHWPHGNTKVIDNVINSLPVKKDKLLCMNFAIGLQKERRGPIRKKVDHIFRNKSFCYKPGKKPFKAYLSDLARSKFVLSPEGNGIDCLRTWESLLVGSIPIVTKSEIDCLFEGLPVLIIDDWSEITEDFLLAKYEEMRSKQYSMERLYADYWLDKIECLKNLVQRKFYFEREFVVNFHESMSRSKNYKKSFAEKNPKWQKVKSLFEDNLVNNIEYSDEPKIPKIIHQIWLGNNGKLPEKYHRLQKTWLDMHPGWEYKLWTEKEIDEFGLIRRDLYDETTNYGPKSDIVRYEILYRIGGLYVDTDFECLKPFDIFHHLCDFYAGIAYDKSVEIFCGLIGSVPGHPVLKRCIYDMKKKTKPRESGIDILHRTSVYFFTKCFFKEIDKHSGPSTVLPITYFYPWPHYLKNQNSPKQVAKWINRETFGNHHWHVSWSK